jgi:hypothetical protein
VNEGFVDFGAAAADEGSEAGDVKAGVNIPLGDQMAARVVATTRTCPARPTRCSPTSASTVTSTTASAPAPARP